MSTAVERLEAIIAESDSPDQSLVVANRTDVDPIQRLLETTFEGQSVGVTEIDRQSAESDTVLLVRGGEVIASSPLDAVADACLLVNSDLYRTGLGGIDRSRAPAVITALDETVFDLRGFPASANEKLLLILISRFIEARALEQGEGVLRATFQELSRLAHEGGTLEVYRRLAGTDLSVHVYGQDDWTIPAEIDLQVHKGTHDGYRRSWCVSFEPPAGSDRQAAMVALETGDNRWRGTWTYDAEKVCRVSETLAEEF